MIAAIACETGIAPSVLLAETPGTIETMLAYLIDRAEQRQRGSS